MHGFRTGLAAFEARVDIRFLLESFQPPVPSPHMRIRLDLFRVGSCHARIACLIFAHFAMGLL